MFVYEKNLINPIFTKRGEEYEDCCTIFTPPHPKTKPSLEEVINAETAMGLEKLFELEQLAADEAEKLRINVQ